MDPREWLSVVGRVLGARTAVVLRRRKQVLLSSVK